MVNRLTLRKRLTWCFRLVVVLFLSVPLQALMLADSFTDRRIHVGTKLFKTLVSADLEINSKLSREQQINIAIIYSNNRLDAQAIASGLSENFSNIQGAHTHYEKLTLLELVDYKDNISAIFIAEPLDDASISQLVAYGVDQHIVIFSPFEGDVERGVLGGLSVQATVRPLINKDTLEKSQLKIKPFYLKVAKLYE